MIRDQKYVLMFRDRDISPHGDRYLYQNFWNWCFENLARPASVYYYFRRTSGAVYSCTGAAQVYRRWSKKLTNKGWSITESGNDHRYRCMFMTFEDITDRDMFLLRWSGDIVLLDRHKFTFESLPWCLTDE